MSSEILIISEQYAVQDRFATNPILHRELLLCRRVWWLIFGYATANNLSATTRRPNLNPLPISIWANPFLPVYLRHSPAFSYRASEYAKQHLSKPSRIT